VDDRYPVGLLLHYKIARSDPWLTHIFLQKTGKSTVWTRRSVLDKMVSSTSSDEGEIRDGIAEKATTTLPHYDGAPVDRQDRNRPSVSPSMSPEPRYRPSDRDSSERWRPSYPERGHRGSKRARGDDYTDRPRGDPRRFKAHYEDDAPSSKRRSQLSYDDLDRGDGPKSDLPYDDRDRYSQKRARTRSRSPYRSGRRGDRDAYGSQSRESGHRGYTDAGRPNSSYGRGDVRSRDIQDQSVSNRGQTPLPADNAKQEAKFMQGLPQQTSERSNETHREDR
jgi:serine/threonine-protein kinase PRP4